MKKTYALWWIFCLVFLMAFSAGCAATKETITAYDKDGKVVTVTEKLNNYYVTRVPKSGKETLIPKPGWWTTIFTSFFKEASSFVEEGAGTITGK